MDKNIDKMMVVRAVISTIKEGKEPDKIEAKDLRDYDSPAGISFKGYVDGLVPDVAVYRNDEVDLYEVELDENIDVDKWRLMSLYTRKYKGHLFLVVPDFLREKVKSELKNNSINAGLMYFNT